MYVAVVMVCTVFSTLSMCSPSLLILSNIWDVSVVGVRRLEINSRRDLNVELQLQPSFSLGKHVHNV